MTYQNFLAIAISQVGRHEQGGNNKGPDVERYQRATWMPETEIKKGFAWCAAFICWVMQQWLDTPEGRNFLARHLTFKRCRDASAFGFEEWGRKNGCDILPSSAMAKAGDIVIFNFSHIGIVETDQAKTATISTIEGNTGAAGARDTKDGTDGVMRKVRNVSLVKCYVRLPS